MPAAENRIEANSIAQGIDVIEDSMLLLDKELLQILLFDRTTRSNIIWATKDYEYLGEDYSEFSAITPLSISLCN